MTNFLEWLLWGNQQQPPWQQGVQQPPGMGSALGGGQGLSREQLLQNVPGYQQPPSMHTPSPPLPPSPPPPSAGAAPSQAGWWPFGSQQYQGPQGNNLGIGAKRPNKREGFFTSDPRANIPQYRKFEPVPGQPGTYKKERAVPQKGEIILGKDGKYYMYKGGNPDDGKAWKEPSKDEVTEYHRQETQKRQGRLEERHEKEYKERKEERKQDKEEKRSEWEISREDRLEYRRQAEETRRENKEWREKQAGERKEERAEGRKIRAEEQAERAQERRAKAMQSAFSHLGRGLPQAHVPGASVHVPQAGNVFQSLTQALTAASKRRQ